MSIRYCMNGCGNTLGLMARSNTKCRNCKEQELRTLREANREQRNALRKLNGAVLVHSCMSSEFDNFDAHKCQCKQTFGEKKIQDLFKQGAVRNLNPDHRRFDCWDKSSDVFWIGKQKFTPRVQTIEKAHILRSVQGLRNSRGKSPEQLEADHKDLQRRIAEDKLERSEEERHRWEVWADLQQEWFKSTTVEIPEAQWYAAEIASRGDLVCRTCIHKEDRTSAGIDRSRRYEDLEIEEDYDATTENADSENAPDDESTSSNDDLDSENEISPEPIESSVEAENEEFQEAA